MRLDTSVKYLSELKLTIRSIFSATRIYQLDHDGLLDLRESRLFADPRYARLPRWAKAELSGYFDACSDNVWQLVEWRVKLDGKFVDGKTEVPDGRWAEVEPGAHFWRGTDKHYTYPTED